MSANTDVLRKLLKKQNEWIWTDEHTEAFNKLKEGISKIPCLAHYNAQNENIIATDASTKDASTGGNVMAKTKRWKFKTSRIRKQIFIGHRKENAINELELLAVVWGLEHFRLYIYGKPVELLTDHQALEPLIKTNRTNKTYSARLTRW